ncbi:MAG: AAA family ATPase [Acidilobus sp.]
MLIIAVTGMPGSGKSTVSQGLSRELRAPLFVMGDIVREEVVRRGLPLTAENVELVATELRSKYGRGAVGKLLYDRLKGLSSEYVVVDGLRSPEEVEILRSLAPTCVVAVHAAPSIRLSRYLARGRKGESVDSFSLRERKNLEYGIGEVIAEADYMVINEGGLEDLLRAVKGLAEAIKGGEWKSRCGSPGKAH